MKRLGLVCIMLLAWVPAAQAGGYQIPEMGTKAMGMGNAFTAVADDASALWYNPAGLAFSKHTQIMLGGTTVLPNTTYTSNAGVNTSPKDATVFAPNVYVSSIQEDTGIAWGLGINAPFGLKVDWPTTAPFASNALFGKLEALVFNPNVAFRVSDKISVAVGADYAWLRKVNFDKLALKQDFHGDGWGYNVGLLYKSDVFNIGLTYRSKIKIDANGFSNLPTLGPSSLNTVQVTMPDMFSGGIAFFPVEGVTVSINVDWVNWKKFQKLQFNYSSPTFPLAPSATEQENWKATTAFRVGLEWAYSDNMRARFGYTYDPTPVKDANFTPLLPSNDINSFSVGYGYDINKHLTLDLAYMYVKFKNRQQTASTGTKVSRNGLYKINIHYQKGLFGAPFLKE